MKLLVPFAIAFSTHLLAQDQVSSRVTDFEMCLSANAEQLDDRISPAAQVARIVALECSREWDRFLALTADRFAARRLQLMDEYPPQRVLDMATKAVLLARKPN